VSLREVEPPKEHASWYDFAAETIVLVRGYGDEADSFAHETGHHVHLKIFTPAQQVAWAAFWQAHRLEMPSRYGRQSAVEGFPELFSYWVRGKPIRPVLKQWLGECFG